MFICLWENEQTGGQLLVLATETGKTAFLRVRKTDSLLWGAEWNVPKDVPHQARKEPRLRVVPCCVNVQERQ